MALIKDKKLCARVRQARAFPTGTLIWRGAPTGGMRLDWESSSNYTTGKSIEVRFLLGEKLVVYLNHTHLPHILRPDQYVTESQLELEKAELFDGAWHLVGDMDALPNDGDFLTLELMETSIIIWRCEGECRAYLNVCPHRFSQLLEAESGNCTRIRCPYHGWEYDGLGATRHIPDSKNFRPLTKRRVGLVQFPLERLGQLLFVRLTEEGPSLREYLGPAYEECQAFYDDQWELIWSWQPVLPGNWKLAYEITMENYHVGTAHANTLGQFPLAAEEDCKHELHGPRHSLFRADRREDHYPAIDYERSVMQLLGGEAACQYVHWHAYPHLGFFSQNVFSIAQAVYPISATEHINFYRLYAYRGSNRGWRCKRAQRFLRKVLRKLWIETFQEDADVVRRTQEGLSNRLLTDHRLDLEGLLSVREERIFHFHEFVQEASRSGEQPASQLKRST